LPCFVGALFAAFMYLPYKLLETRAFRLFTILIYYVNVYIYLLYSDEIMHHYIYGDAFIVLMVMALATSIYPSLVSCTVGRKMK
jgi:hypothetical protein